MGGGGRGRQRGPSWRAIEFVSTPVLHVLAGPNGAGKSTFVARVLGPATRLECVNADESAAQVWPGEEESHAYDASRLAEARRRELLVARQSFLTETVFSHQSKQDLIDDAVAAGYLVTVHVVLVPEDLSVARVELRAADGGHTVPEEKIRARHRRLWALVAQARDRAYWTHIYDNGAADHPFRRIASYRRGHLVETCDWPDWAPAELRS